MIKNIFSYLAVCILCVSCTPSLIPYDDIPLTQEALSFISESGKTIDLIHQAKMLEPNIPILESYLDDGLTKPLIIFLHGANGNKESLLYLQTEFAKKGFYTISIDLQSHGDRNDKTSSFTDVLINTGKDLDKVIKYARSNILISSKRFGMIGFSMGGMITHWYSTHGKYSPTIIAPIASTPDWEDFASHPLVNYSYKNGVNYTSESLHENEVNTLLKNNPMSLLKKYKNTVVILAHGENDDLISANPDRIFYQSLNAMNHIRVEYHAYTGVGHTIPNDFILVLYDRFTQVLISNNKK